MPRHARGMHEATAQVINDKLNEIVTGTAFLEEGFLLFEFRPNRSS
jgi:hypothetical protein